MGGMNPAGSQTGLPLRSFGTPEIESQDPPPDEPVTVGMERVAETTPVDGTDLKRADDAQRQHFDPAAMTDAAEEGIDSSR